MQNYEIMSGDTLVAVWRNKRLEVVCPQLLPLYLKKVSDADLWLSTRAVDSHRPNSRLLKKALRMAERDDVATALQVNGVTITDNYWVREIGSNLHYSDVCFGTDYFNKKASKSGAKLALTGKQSSFRVVSEAKSSRMAELTNTGSFEKCWKNKDGKWWLYKTATHNEAFSEIFIYNLCEEIGINCAVYGRDDANVKSLDFTGEKYNFEPAFTFMGDNEDYEDIHTALMKLCPDAVPDFVRMIFLDALVYNPDRHTANFGLLRDKENGSLVGFAPCFDHNMALVSRGYPTAPFKSDLLITLFNDFMAAHSGYVKYIPAVTEKAVKKALEKTAMRVKEQTVTDFIMFRYNAIKK